MLRTAAALLTGTVVVTCLTHLPAQAADTAPGIENCTSTACHFDVAPGNYHVKVTLGGAEASSTAISGETRRALLATTDVAAGDETVRSFTVNVRTPEGEPTGATGTPGLDLVLGGSAPALADIRVTPAPHVPQIFVIGDSTAADWLRTPYTGWAQQLPQLLRKGVAVANYADAGESTVSFLAETKLFPTVEPLIGPGDKVLIQLAHNDKTTDEATYRANLETLVGRVRAQGGTPVLLTPVVRRRFSDDGTLNNDLALLVNGLGVDHPKVIREVAAAHDVPLLDITAASKALVEELGPDASKSIYLTDEKGDNTHTSTHGATVYAGLVRDALVTERVLRRSAVRPY
ncbi:rhamnogalacturonan acetylesterase [Streptomyces sp. NPDC003832]